jgi:hypothetical protein
MKKKILALVLGTMLTASVGYAAPLTDLKQGETNIGYMHYNMSDSVDSDSFHLETGVSDKFILGVERSGFADNGFNWHATDIYAHYKIDPNLRLIVGNRDYSDGPNKFFYGIGATTNLAPKLDGYASVTRSSIATEWQTGLAYKLDQQTSLHLGYKSYKEDNFSTLDGLGFCVTHKF